MLCIATFLNFEFFNRSRLANDQLTHAQRCRSQGLHRMPRFHLTLLHCTCTQAPDLTRISKLSLPLLCRAGAIFCSLSVWPLHCSPHAVSLAVSTMAITMYRAHHTYSQRSTITMAPSSTNGTSPYRPVSSATTTDLA